MSIICHICTTYCTRLCYLAPAYRLSHLFCLSHLFDLSDLFHLSNLSSLSSLSSLAVLSHLSQNSLLYSPLACKGRYHFHVKTTTETPALYFAFRISRIALISVISLILRISFISFISILRLKCLFLPLIYHIRFSFCTQPHLSSTGIFGFSLIQLRYLNLFIRFIALI